MSNPTIEPITSMLDRWWAATQAGAHDDAVIILGLWRAEVIAEAARGPRTGHQP